MVVYLHSHHNRRQECDAFAAAANAAVSPALGRPPSAPLAPFACEGFGPRSFTRPEWEYLVGRSWETEVAGSASEGEKEEGRLWTMHVGMQVRCLALRVRL